MSNQTLNRNLAKVWSRKAIYHVRALTQLRECKKLSGANFTLVETPLRIHTGRWFLSRVCRVILCLGEVFPTCQPHSSHSAGKFVPSCLSTSDRGLRLSCHKSSYDIYETAKMSNIAINLSQPSLAELSMKSFSLFVWWRLKDVRSSLIAHRFVINKRHTVFTIATDRFSKQERIYTLKWKSTLIQCMYTFIGTVNVCTGILTLGISLAVKWVPYIKFEETARINTNKNKARVIPPPLVRGQPQHLSYPVYEIGAKLSPCHFSCMPGKSHQSSIDYYPEPLMNWNCLSLITCWLLENSVTESLTPSKLNLTDCPLPSIFILPDDDSTCVRRKKL